MVFSLRGVPALGHFPTLHAPHFFFCIQKWFTSLAYSVQTWIGALNYEKTQRTSVPPTWLLHSSDFPYVLRQSQHHFSKHRFGVFSSVISIVKLCASKMISNMLSLQLKKLLMGYVSRYCMGKCSTHMISVNDNYLTICHTFWPSFVKTSCGPMFRPQLWNNHACK